MSTSVMVFAVTIFCVPHLRYCQEDHLRMAVPSTSHLESALRKSDVSPDVRAGMLHTFSDMNVCKIFVKESTSEIVAEIAALPGSKFISYYCTYESPAASYALIRHYNGHIERHIIPGAE